MRQFNPQDNTIINNNNNNNNNDNFSATNNTKLAPNSNSNNDPNLNSSINLPSSSRTSISFKTFQSSFQLESHKLSDPQEDSFSEDSSLNEEEETECGEKLEIVEPVQEEKFSDNTSNKAQLALKTRKTSPSSSQITKTLILNKSEKSSTENLTNDNTIQAKNSLTEEEKKALKKKELSQRRRGKRRKIKIEYIQDRSKRYVAFSKRKAGIIKKAYELSELTGTEIMVLIASKTGNIYSFATPKLQPMVSEPEGKMLISTCLNTFRKSKNEKDSIKLNFSSNSNEIEFEQELETENAEENAAEECNYTHTVPDYSLPSDRILPYISEYLVSPEGTNRMHMSPNSQNQHYPPEQTFPSQTSAFSHPPFSHSTIYPMSNPSLVFNARTAPNIPQYNSLYFYSPDSSVTNITTSTSLNTDTSQRINQTSQNTISIQTSKPNIDNYPPFIPSKKDSMDKK